MKSTFYGEMSWEFEWLSTNKIAFAQLGDLQGNSIISMCLFVCWKTKWKKHISWLINIFPIRLFGDVPYDCKISHVACFMNAH